MSKGQFHKDHKITKHNQKKGLSDVKEGLTFLNDIFLFMEAIVFVIVGGKFHVLKIFFLLLKVSCLKNLNIMLTAPNHNN